MKNKKWSIQISKIVADKLKSYCKKNGYKMNSIVEESLLQTILAPPIKCENRFLCYFHDLKSEVPVFLICKVERPKVSLDREKKKATWHPISMSLFDTCSPNTAQLIENIIATDNKFNLEIVLYDKIGTRIESWMLTDGVIIDANFGTMDFTNSKSSEIGLVIDYKFAKLIL
jgi:hypothetical protein